MHTNLKPQDANCRKHQAIFTVGNIFDMLQYLPHLYSVKECSAVMTIHKAQLDWIYYVNWEAIWQDPTFPLKLEVVEHWL